MTASEIRARFLSFFEHHGHTVVPSSSLIPDDPSVLLTTAGMQQFKPYYADLDPTVTVHPLIGKPIGRNATSAQKSFRTSDIEEVGDERHLTFFEMLGNFSFGGYFKKEAITLAHAFLTREMGLSISYVTIFEGKESIGVPKDTESREIWKSLGIPDEQIIEQGMDDVFWGPTGASGPCGPTTEIYCRNSAGQDIEVWNIVFNQFFYPGSREELNQGVEGKQLAPLPTPGVDTGMGLERLVMVVNEKPTVFATDLFEDSILAPLRAQPEYQGTPEHDRSLRVIADHVRAATFLIGDGVLPGNKERGYILRRLIRRAMMHGQYLVGFPLLFLRNATDFIVDFYSGAYPDLLPKREAIREVFHKEQDAFVKTYEGGIKEFRKILEKGDAVLPGADLFALTATYGFPFELTEELALRAGRTVDHKGFLAEMEHHRELSRAGQEKKFGGHGLILDTGELKAGSEAELQTVTRLHTATHMLQRALREVLGPDVGQAGSDITAERTRFDFTFPRKLTPEEIQKVEDLVNEKIREDLPMQKMVLPKEAAVKTGALFFFKEKYPDPVNVYFIGHDLDSAWSKEFCGGPHVTHTGEIGAFRIVKEEAVSSGVRRIRGVVQ